MANPDRPGFRPVRSQSGLTSWDHSLAAPVLVDDAYFDTEASAICIGHPVVATATENAIAGELGHLPLVAPMTDNHDEAGTDLVYGVVVGISKLDGSTTFNNLRGQFMGGPNDLGVASKYVTSAEVEADTDGVIVWVARASEWIFEAQVETAAQETARGVTYDLTNIDDGTDEIVDTVTGRPKVALVSGGGQFLLTEIPSYIDNDPEAADTRVWGKFLDTLTTDTASGSTSDA